MTAPLENNPAPPPATPDDLFTHLARLGIAYKLFHHAPIFTVAEGEHLKATIPGVHCRNLFLRDKAGTQFLVVLANKTVIDLKVLPAMIGSGKLSFGSPERLWSALGVRPGSVCPFALINDPGHHVKIMLDASMMRADLVCYHPLDNGMSLCLTPQNLLNFIESTGHSPHIVEL